MILSKSMSVQINNNCLGDVECSDSGCQNENSIAVAIAGGGEYDNVCHACEAQTIMCETCNIRAAYVDENQCDWCSTHTLGSVEEFGGAVGYVPGEYEEKMRAYKETPEGKLRLFVFDNRMTKEVQMVETEQDEDVGWPSLDWDGSLPSFEDLASRQHFNF